uniref:Uncharacterized protein n=1 Tax=Oryza rufipogon TaxID=4529 RepID=A0A0E0Q5W3_ORYRU
MENALVVGADMEWCDEYGTGSEEWTTKVEIKTKNVPEHANHPEIMERLVSSFCDAQTYMFDAVNKDYYICGFAQSIESIPKSKHLKLKYGTSNGVRIKSFLLNLEASLYAGPESNAITEAEDSEIYEDPEIYEDLDVVREFFETHVRLEHIADGQESSSSADGSLGMSVDFDWSLKYSGR